MVSGVVDMLCCALYYSLSKLPATVYIVFSIGFVSIGEHNVLRATGYTRPLSVFKVRSSVRNKYAKMSTKKLRSLITPVGMFLA